MNFPSNSSLAVCLATVLGCAEGGEREDATFGSTNSDTSEDGSTDSDTEDDTTGTTETTETSDGTESTGESSEDDPTDGEETGAVPVTIYEIQDGTIDPGSDVEVLGVWVSAVGTTGFYAQETAGGAYSGVWVVADAPDVGDLAIGDLVDIVGTTAELAGATQLDATDGLITESGDISPPAPEEIAISEFADAWEGVFVRVAADMTVIEVIGSQFDVSDGNYFTGIDDALYDLVGSGDFANFGVGAGFSAVQGILRFDAELELSPRGPTDLEGYQAFDPGMSVEDLAPGDLVVTEIMSDPQVCADTGCEWIEIFNASGSSVDLLGLRIQDSQLSVSFEGEVAVSLVVAPDGYVVLGKGPMASWTYMFAADGFTGSLPAFNNSTDLVVLLNSTEIIDQTASYPDEGAADNGVSWKLNGAPSAVANDSPANWCASPTAFEASDYGSPKVANPAGCNPL